MSAPGLRHVGFLHRDDREYLAGVTGFARRALGRGDAVLVAVPEHRLGRLRAALGDHGDQVSFADLSAQGRNPGRILAGVALPFANDHRGRPLAVVSEPVWPGRSELELDACAIHEAVSNVIFAGWDAEALCPYAVDGPAVSAARRTHPELIDDGVRRPSAAYGDPLQVADEFDRPLPPVPAYARTLNFCDREDLAVVRRFVRGAGPEVLVYAVNELVTNSVRYAGGGRIALWTEPGVVVCQVDDTGVLDDPLAGRMPPPLTSTSGRGLLLVNEMCDLVRVHRRPDSTSVRVHLRVD